MNPVLVFSNAVKLIVFILAGCVSSALAQVSQPNVVFIMSDDAGYADYGFMNQLTGQTTEFQTPNLDQLAGQSVLMSKGYVTSPICAPSRAGILTGRYQQRFGFGSNALPSDRPNEGIPTDEVLLTERFKQLGYTTGYIGKWHVGEQPDTQPLSQGVDEFYGVLESSRKYFKDLGGPNKVRRGLNPIAWYDEPSFNNIPNDPTKGRHVTDAFGDEASKFIATHAADAEPFFLTVSFTSPHLPIDTSKKQDFDAFEGTSLTEDRRRVAALTRAHDRAVGNVLSRLQDPNGDGDTSDSVDDNTIVVFVNDNGGPTIGDGTNPPYDNGPLKGWKGTAWEGGTRVPFLIRAPGLTPGVFDQRVSSLDLFPTLVGAAGGLMTTPTDGVDLFPFLTGNQSGEVHELLFQRNAANFASVHKGEWKFVKAESRETYQLFRLNPDGSGEDVDLREIYPEKVQELIRDYVDWETTIDKPRNTSDSRANRFDVFRQRVDLAQGFNWRWTQGWENGEDPSQTANLVRQDSSPNTIFVFDTRDDASYTSLNNVNRMSGLSFTLIDNGTPDEPGMSEFFANQLRFEGEFAGTSDRSGTILGNALMMVRSLDGQGPRIHFESLRGDTTRQFTSNIDLDLVLHKNLILLGSGDMTYNINGQMRDFFGPNKLTKEGINTITLTGHNIYAGDTRVNNGHLRIEGPDAALDGTANVLIGSAGRLTLAEGLIRTGSLDTSSGGVFDFEGGSLQLTNVFGDLTVNGGTFELSPMPATVSISGNYDQAAGMLSVEIGGELAGAEYDQLLIAGDASLAGTLEISLIDLGNGIFEPGLGDSFEILTATSSLTGAFDSYLLPALSSGQSWAVQYGANSLSLAVIDHLPGDFDIDLDVDGFDLVVWESSYGLGLAADADQDGDTDGNDFLSWQRDFGREILSSQVAAAQVPESSTLRCCIAILMVSAGTRLVSAGTRRTASQWSKDFC